VALAKPMQKLALDPQALANAAERARAVGRPDAARDLADLVEETGGDSLAIEETVLRPLQGSAFA
jgi:UDP-N-acetylglucosamine--N-acetylmuramyl-(pentapeptide) pyrophosphoryl-undecaprenol N-acetylglucosamine transferase